MFCSCMFGCHYYSYSGCSFIRTITMIIIVSNLLTTWNCLVPSFDVVVIVVRFRYRSGWWNWNLWFTTTTRTRTRTTRSRTANITLWCHHPGLDHRCRSLRITPVVQDGSIIIQIISTTSRRTSRTRTSSISTGRLLQISILISRDNIDVVVVRIRPIASTCRVLGGTCTTSTATMS